MDEKIYNLFVGEKGSDSVAIRHGNYELVKALEEAKSLKKAHETGEKIRVATGWFQGRDGGWMYEISDRDAEFKAHLDTCRELLNAPDEGIVHSMGDVLSHPQLYFVYPHLSKTKVTFINNKELSYRGGFTSDNSIVINVANLKDEKEALSTLLHETQHWIQDIEGLSRGAGINKAASDKTKDNINVLISKTLEAKNEWEFQNEHLIENANTAKKKSTYASLYNSYLKIANYLVEGRRLTSVQRHIRNETCQLYSQAFHGDDCSEELKEDAAKLALDWYNLPKSNYGGKKEEFLQKFTQRFVDLLIRRIPSDELDEILLDKRSIATIRKNRVNDAFEAQQSISQTNDFRAMEKYLKGVKSMHERSAPNVTYFHTEGEVWARVTQSRINMTDQERKALSPYESVDVNVSKIIPTTVAGVINNVYWNGAQLSSDVISTTTKFVNKGHIEFLDNGAFANITLNSASDAQSVIHESGHLFLEMYSRLNQDVNLASDSPARQNFLKILKWAGVSEDEWFAMDSTEKENIHETFATSFESYISNGEIEKNHPLSDVFKEFRGWLKSIYNKIGLIHSSTKELDDVFKELIKPSTQINDEFRSAIESQISSCIEDNTLSKASSIILDCCFENMAKQANMDRAEICSRFSITFSRESKQQLQEQQTAPLIKAPSV